MTRRGWTACSVLLAGLLAGLLTAGCAVPERPTQSPVSPQPPHLTPIEQVAQGGVRLFAPCQRCTPPTPKTLRAQPLAAPGSPQAIPPAQMRVPSPVPVPPPSPTPEHATAAPTPTPTRAASLQLEATLYFDSGSSTIRPGEQARLQALVPVLEQADALSVRGFTDDRGSRLVNAQLAEARAQTVAVQVVRARGRPVATSAQALCCYAARGTSPEARQANRRAVIGMTVPDTDAVRALLQPLAPHVLPAPRGATTP